MPPLNLEAIPSLRHSLWARLLLGPRVLNGLSVGVGLALLTVLMFVIVGPAASASTSVGMLIMSIADQLAPSRGKLRQIAPVLWLATPFTLAMQLAFAVPVHSTWAIGAVVAVGGFLGMLGTAWGARGAPLGFALVLAIVFALSTEPPAGWRAIAEHLGWFELGTLLYAGWALLTAWLLNLRFRRLVLADAVNELATMLREQGARIAATGDRRENELRALLSEQAVLADKLQTARDFVLDVPRTPAELRLTGMLVAAIRLREQALAVELEIDMRATRGQAPMNVAEAEVLETLWSDIAAHLDRVCWSLYTRGTLTGDLAASLERRRARADSDGPEALRPMVEAMLAEMQSLLRLAEGGPEESRLELAAQSRDWPRFRTTLRWPIAPLKRAMHGRSPVLRYAVRVALALAVGDAIGEQLPWATHPHWILLTIAVVMRTNLAQTIERRNARLAGTLIGCVLVTGVLSLHPPIPVQFGLMALGAGLAHGFAQVRYLVAATAATVLALIQGHLLHTAGEFALFERLADTLIGTAIAWAFSYVLPAWERRQLPALLVRLREAQIAHARIALAAVEPASGNVDWRLARREVLDALAAIGTAAQRALSEPQAVRPPLELLERVQLRSYRLIAQLGGLRSWRERPGWVDDPEVSTRLATHLERIGDALAARAVAGRGVAVEPGLADEHECPDGPIEPRTEAPPAAGATAQLERRLADADEEAIALGRDLAAAEALVRRLGG